MLLPPYPGIIVLSAGLSDKVPIVLIVGKDKKERIYEDLGFFYKNPIIFYRENSIEVAGRIREKTFDVLVISLEDLSFGIPLLSEWKLARGDNLPYEEFLFFLADGGYERTEKVIEKGEFSVRGSIIDLFPHSQENPVRIELEDEKILSLRHFSPYTQRTISYISSIVIFTSTERTICLKDLLNDFFIVGEKNELIKSDIVLSPIGSLIPIKSSPSFNRSLESLRNFLRRYQDYTTYLILETPGEIDRMKELLDPDFPYLFYKQGHLSKGFIIDDIKIAFVTESDIFGITRKKVEKKIELEYDIFDFKEGDYVVNDEFGIGIFDGLEKISVEGNEVDCLKISYKGGDRLFVPVDKIYLVKKYIGAEGRVEIDSLSKQRWLRKKTKVQKSIKEIAEKMLKLYARRRASEGWTFSEDTLWQKEMEALFPFEETEDQLRAVEDVKRDMEKSTPMDRLLCGGVGFGKTEVALRAAFKAAMDGKQTAILAPTTILAEQHYITFRDRLSRFPIKVEFLSRFTKSRENKILQELKDGKIDIIIGTHRLLSRDVTFKDLGLLIIDEEQRFGVKQKDKIKEMKENIDYLALSATPIPRTLNLALSGLMDLSVIETPPVGRMSVVTEVIHWDENIIYDAVMREIQRGGQVFFVHNRIETIYGIYEKLQKIFPELRIIVAHGQMPPRKLESSMVDFIERKYHVLLSTAIIESGLDIPNVNTIIINDAHRFGLADLHQLRGRVGRSTRKGFCYLIIPPGISEEAYKRISAVKTYSHLGAGLKIALVDMEMRGAGLLLGTKQHGFIEKVGYELYMRMLDETVKEIKGEKVKKRIETEVRLNRSIYIPAEYIQYSDSRIRIYRRLAAAEKEEEIENIKEEVIDIYGRPPRIINDLFEWAKIRLKAMKAGIQKIIENEEFTVEFGEEITRESIEKMVKEIPGIKFYYGKNLRIKVAHNQLKKLLELLT